VGQVPDPAFALAHGRGRSVDTFEHRWRVRRVGQSSPTPYDRSGKARRAGDDVADERRRTEAIAADDHGGRVETKPPC